ncbi:MAG: hypothetical protein ABIP08_12190 [Lautropia sp.]
MLRAPQPAPYHGGSERCRRRNSRAGRHASWNGWIWRRCEDALRRAVVEEVREAALKENCRRPSRTDIQVSWLTELPELSSIKVFALDQDETARDYDKVIALERSIVQGET